MEHRTVIDQIEIKSDGSVFVRCALQIVDGDNIVQSEYHRFALPVGHDTEAQIAFVNEQLTAMGRATIDKRDERRIARIAGHVWTPKVRAKYEAKKALAQADALAKEAEDRGEMAKTMPDEQAKDELASVERLRETARSMRASAEKAEKKAAALKDEDDKD